MEEVLVSIWCITYNHEQYIRDALESFLEQETDFRYEIVVHDDASTDNTARIIKEFEEKYPKLIHGIYQTENQTSRNGTDRKWIWAIQAQHCKGKYIALCDGDDFWSDSRKLQIQINYMEKYPECVLTAHDAVLMNIEKGEAKVMQPYDGDRDISADEIIMQYHGMLPASSMVFQKKALAADFHQYFLGAGIGDYPLQLWMMTRGRVHYFDRVMSVYRYMHKGSWNQRVTADIKHIAAHTVQMIYFLKEFDKYTEGKYQSSIMKRIEKYEKSMLLQYCQYFPLTLFKKRCDEYDRENNGRYHEELEGVMKQFSCMFPAQECGWMEDIRQFHQKYRYIYIMGAGTFGAAMAGQMKYNSLDFEGFTVSGQVGKENVYLGKPVWGLGGMPHPLEETGIIIGMNLEKWPDAIENLKKAGIKNYLIPEMLESLMNLANIVPV